MYRAPGGRAPAPWRRGAGLGFLPARAVRRRTRPLRRRPPHAARAPAARRLRRSLAALLVAARFFTGAAERIGLAFGMSPFIVGVFIVAIGTSLPELVASVLSVLGGTSEIVAGNVLGANAATCCSPRRVSVAVPAGASCSGESTDHRPALPARGDARPSHGRWPTARDVARACCCSGCYVIYVSIRGRRGATRRPGRGAAGGAARRRARPAPDGRATPPCCSPAGVGIYLSASAPFASLERSPPRAAHRAGHPPRCLPLGWHTLPELAVSVTAARRGLARSAVGQHPRLVHLQRARRGRRGRRARRRRRAEPAAAFALPFVGAASLLFYLLTQDKRISRWEGLLFLVLFALFLAKVAGIG
jgi:cation:H+ antiporter